MFSDIHLLAQRTPPRVVEPRRPTAYATHRDKTARPFLGRFYHEAQAPIGKDYQIIGTASQGLFQGLLEVGVAVQMFYRPGELNLMEPAMHDSYFIVSLQETFHHIRASRTGAPDNESFHAASSD
ncbi:MAG: hypothetical protein QGG56_06715 [Dehalococcoidia bacterium]|nr:hypothetical protein [Dehalococcoidia bacterium]